VREAFTSQGKGKVLLSADYSQMELRLLAHMSSDPVLQKAFRDGEDIHASTAAKVFGVEVSEVSSEQRSQAKAINFGIMYGMGPVRLAQQTGVTMAEAKDFITRYFETFPKVRSYLDGAIESAKTNGYAKTLLGRRRPIPNLHSPSPMLVSAAQNVAVNTPVQGSAADLIKMAMIRLDQKLARGDFASKMVLQVHDELVLEVAEDELEEVQKLTVEAMQSVFDLEVPLSVDAGSGKNWLEAH
jgi:DNA polymerase-1